MKEKKYYLEDGRDAKKMYFKAQCSINRMKELGIDDYWIDYCKIDKSTLFSWTKEYISKDKKYRFSLQDIYHQERNEKFMSLTYIDEKTRLLIYNESKELVKKNNYGNNFLNSILSSLFFMDYENDQYGFIVDVKMSGNNTLFKELIDDYLFYINKSPLDMSIYYYFIHYYNSYYKLGLDAILDEIKLHHPSVEDFRNMIRLSAFQEMINKTSSLGLAMEYYSIFHDLLLKYEIGYNNKYITLKTILSQDERDLSFSGLLLDLFDLNKINEFNEMYNDAMKIFKTNLDDFYYSYIEFAMFNAIYRTNKQEELMKLETKESYEKYMEHTKDFLWDAFRYLVGFNVDKDEEKAYKILNSQEKKIGSFFERNFSFISVIKGDFRIFRRREIKLYRQMFDEINK